MVFLISLFDETRVCVSLERRKHHWRYLGQRNLVTLLSTRATCSQRSRETRKGSVGQKGLLEDLLQTTATDGTHHPARTTESGTKQEIPPPPPSFLQDHMTLKATRKVNFK